MHLKKTRHLGKLSKAGSTLLHHVCCFQPPLKVVQEIHSLYPGMVMVRDVFGRLPLHEACRFKASREVVDFLVKSYIAAAYTQDRQGKTPLHYAVDAGLAHEYLLLDVIMSLSVAAPGSLNIRDARGSTPVDILSHRGGREATALIKYLSPMAASYRRLATGSVMPFLA